MNRILDSRHFRALYAKRAIVIGNQERRCGRGRLLLGGLAMAASATLVLYVLYRSWDYVKVDLDVYRLGGSAILYGHALYGPLVQYHGFPFTYTPFSAMLFVPLAVLSRQPAQLLWTALSLICLTGFLWQAVEYAAPRRSRRTRVLTTAVTLGLALLLRPVRENFELGQINIVLAFAILLDLRRRTGRIPGGVLLGIAAAIKLTPLLFIPYLFLTGRRRDAITAAGTFLACTVAGALVALHASVQYWTKLAWDPSHVRAAGPEGPAFVTNQSLYGFFSRVMQGSEHVGMLYTGSSLLALAMGLGLAVHARRTGRAMIGDILCACTALLLSPISWSPHWVWVIPAMLWLTISEDAPRWGKPAAAGCFLLFALGPIYWVPNNTEYHWHGWELLAGNSYLLAAVVFIAGTGHYLLTSRQPGRHQGGRDPVRTGAATVADPPP